MIPYCILVIEDDDDRAFMERLYNNYHRLMYSKIIEILKDEWDTEDVMQSVLEKLIDKIPELIIFIDGYSKEIRDSAVRNQMLYPEYEDFDESVLKLKDWLTKRCEVLKLLYSLDEDDKTDSLCF